jgi:RNA polymerase sigma factor (sigma-70 family)
MHDSEVVGSITDDHSGGGLTEAYDRYADRLYEYCLAALGEPAQAADAVQHTFVIAAARLADLREPDRLRAWLYAVARSECQRIASPGRPEFAAQTQFVMAGAPKVDDEAERARLRALLDDAATGLTPGERELIELELRQGLAVAEVASVVGVSRTRANTLVSRAREHLEDSLTAVVVARAGRRDCRGLSGLLDGWDGQLTVSLRETLHRHIGRCATCSTRRDLELHPARLLGQSPGEALAAAAADSLATAAGAPLALRAPTLALAAGQEPDATAHRTAVLGQTVPFDSQGFPKPAPEPKEAKEAPAGGDEGSPARRRRRVVIATGLVAAAVIAGVAVALTDSSAHGKQPDSHPAGSPPPTRPSPAASSGVSPATSAASSAAPKPTSPATTAPQRTPAATNQARTPAAPPSATPTPSATGHASSTPTPTATVAQGTLSVSPSGGTLWVPPGGSTISLTAQGGPVTWSSTVSSGSGTVQLSSSSGTIKAGATVTITVTASGSAAGRQLTINPGGTAFTILIALLSLDGGRRGSGPQADRRGERGDDTRSHDVQHSLHGQTAGQRLPVAPGQKLRQGGAELRIDDGPAAGGERPVGRPGRVVHADQTGHRQQRLPGKPSSQLPRLIPCGERVPPAGGVQRDIAVEAACCPGVSGEPGQAVSAVRAGQMNAVVPQEDSVAVRLVVLPGEVARHHGGDLDPAGQATEPPGELPAEFRRPLWRQPDGQQIDV